MQCFATSGAILVHPARLQFWDYMLTSVSSSSR